MKKLLVIFSLLISYSAFAQMQEGTLVVGGGLNFSGNSSKGGDPGSYDRTSTQGSLGISGSYEKFKNNTTAFGFFLGYDYNSLKTEYDFDTNTDMYGYGRHMIRVGPNFSKYIPIREKLYFTVSTSASFGVGRKIDRESDEKANIWSVGLSARPGLAFFLNDNFALNAGIGNLYYGFTSEKSTEDNSNGEKEKDSYHNYGLSFNVNTFNIGLKYFLRTAKSE